MNTTDRIYDALDYFAENVSSSSNSGMASFITTIIYKVVLSMFDSLSNTEKEWLKDIEEYLDKKHLENAKNNIHDIREWLKKHRTPNDSMGITEKSICAYMMMYAFKSMDSTPTIDTAYDSLEEALTWFETVLPEEAKVIPSIVINEVKKDEGKVP